MAAQDFPGKHDTPAAIPPQDRVILHCDMNGFFASVELLERPELRDVPMAVCGDPDSRHGIIPVFRRSTRKLPTFTFFSSTDVAYYMPCYP